MKGDISFCNFVFSFFFFFFLVQPPNIYVLSTGLRTREQEMNKTQSLLSRGSPLSGKKRINKYKSCIKGFVLNRGKEGGS